MATLAAKEQCCVFCVSMLVLLLQAVAAWSSHTPHTGKCFHFDGRKTCLDLASQRSNTTVEGVIVQTGVLDCLESVTL
ncbi:uncharacterized protein LOC135089705 isoform X4 [Scylla paramamosain]|uniref:uncharacterized protein LOC135089705 isoform X4 n=1 Tax=Scylla paramamosain TaxID=85552 RepID=UPI003083B541